MIDAVETVLGQGLKVLDTLDQETYTRALPFANGGTIGGHYRHALEHFSQLQSGLATGSVDYDARNRDVLLETDHNEAIRVTRKLAASLKSLTSRASEYPLEVRCSITYGEEDACTASSTLGRELMFCISHAIHHYAIIALILRSEDRTVPEGFGVAPSTIRHRLQFAGTR